MKNIQKRIIITDTNIITDLNIAGILEQFVELDYVYVADLVKQDEISSKTCEKKIIKKIKGMGVSAEELRKAYELYITQCKLSIYDLINYVVAKNNNYILATGDLD